MHIYKELTEPSAVSHSLACTLVAGSQNQDLLVVRGASLLQYYKCLEVRTEDRAVDRSSDEHELVPQLDAEELANSDTFITSEVALDTQHVRERTATRLVLNGQWSLDGEVTSLGRIRPAKSATDCVVVTFKYAKVAVLAWDADSASFATQSIHSYEKHMFNDQDLHFVNPEFSPLASLDPQSSCLCLVYQKDELAFLPFRTDDDTDMESGSGSFVNSGPAFLPSFLIKASVLDKSIANIIDAAFLNQYREPTLAIVFEPTPTWTGSLSKNKDTARYLVLALDLQTRTSTTIISVQDLPYDISHIVPLDAPVGGSLLVAANELIHIDSSGKLKALAVNEYAYVVTGASNANAFADQKDLGLQLEQCRVVHVAQTRYLVVLQTGMLYYLDFELEGRRVLNMKLAPVETASGVDANLPTPSTLVALESGHVFAGSATGDAKLYSWGVDSVEYLAVGLKPDSKVAVDDLEDIYGNDTSDKATATAGGLSSKLYVDEVLRNYGAINSMVVGQAHAKGSPTLDIVAATGTAQTSALTVFHRSLKPKTVARLDLQGSLRFWAVHPTALSSGAGDSTHWDSYAIGSDDESSSLYSLQGEQIKQIKVPGFLGGQTTIAVAHVLNDAYIIQATPMYLVVYDAEFKKVYETIVGGGDAIRHVSVQDPYVCVLTDQGTKLYLAQPDGLSECAIPELVQSSMTGCIVQSELFGSLFPGHTSAKRKRESDVPIESNPSKVYGGVAICDDLVVYSLLDPARTVSFSGWRTLGPVLSVDDSREAGEDKVDVKQVLWTTIGDDIASDEYLVLLTTDNELHIYKAVPSGDKLKLVKETGLTVMAELKDTTHQVALVPYKHIQSMDGLLSGFVVTGPVSLFVTRIYRSVLRAHRLSYELVTHFGGFSTNAVYGGFGYLSQGTLIISQLDSTTDYGYSWPVKRITFGQHITQLCYHETSGVYAVSVNEEIPYKYVDEDGIPLETMNESLVPASSFRSHLKMLSPMTWTVIDEISFPDNEVVVTLKSVRLTVSERSGRKKEFIALGTSIIRGEDLNSKGNFGVYDAIEVVPQPGRPETSHKIKEVAREEVKGSVTTLCEVEGHLLVSQGQKIIVRNLQEDNSIIPVAFLDMLIYITEAKSLQNLLLLGDAVKGTWLAGFGQEPYRMTTMGRDQRDISVLSGEFVVSRGNLFLVVAAESGTLHLLQYDPEDSTSASGQHLLQRSDFYVGRQVETMVKVPITVDGVISDTEFGMIGAAADGTLVSVIPVPESDFRRLYAVQQQIYDREDHVANLNPRMHRATTLLQYGPTSKSTAVTRNLLDYSAIGHYPTLSLDKRRLYSRKLGVSGQNEVWAALKAVEASLNFF